MFSFVGALFFGALLARSALVCSNYNCNGGALAEIPRLCCLRKHGAQLAPSTRRANTHRIGSNHTQRAKTRRQDKAVATILVLSRLH